MRRFTVAMTNQVERINVSHYATMNNKTSVKHNWRCFKSWSVIGRIESVRIQSDYILKIQKINAMCGRASLRKLRGGWGQTGNHSLGLGSNLELSLVQADHHVAVHRYFLSWPQLSDTCPSKVSELWHRGTDGEDRDPRLLVWTGTGSRGGPSYFGSWPGTLSRCLNLLCESHFCLKNFVTSYLWCFVIHCSWIHLISVWGWQ